MPREIPLKGQKYPMLKKTLDFIEAHFFKVYIQGPRFIHFICVKKTTESSNQASLLSCSRRGHGIMRERILY